ncbi:MAG: acetate--CoA ligase family protein [Bacteroidales bacterium]|nr:acetate--CoA ligase family protein [Bacteroidales bacterium]MBN2819572.1 acetate--CoA ligase family protein [Bacteroidales bacterium]
MINSTLINPGSIAIVGASKNLEKPGGRLVVNLVDQGFKGEVYPVNPKENEIYGLKVYQNIESLPQTDMAVLAVPALVCVEVAEQMVLTKSTKAFIIISAGFSEMGEEGRALENRIKSLAEQYHVSVIGPNCIGVLNNNYKAVFTSPLPKNNPGGVDFVSASGAFAVFLFEMAAKYGLQFGDIFTVGNSVNIGVEEVLKYWNDTFRPGKSGIVKMVYAEQIRKPAMFFEQIQKLSKKHCHVIVLKTGDSEAGARAAYSHTGSMAGDAEAYNYLIEKAGAIRCFSREEMVYIANILSQRELKGKNLAIITHAGGPGVMLTDQLQKSGFKVPELDDLTKKKLLTKLNPGSSAVNPVDMLATANKEQLSFAISTCENLKYIDGLVVIYGKTGMEDLFKTYEVLHESVLKCTKPVYTVLPSISSGAEETQYFTDKGHAVYTDEVIFGRCLDFVNRIPELNNFQLYIDEGTFENCAKLQVLSEDKVQERLKWSGIPYVHSFILNSEKDIDKLRETNYPLVAKVMGILHKTESRGVILNIQNKHELTESFKTLIGIKGATGVLVQEMLNGVELYLGGKKHSGIGYSVHAGIGGVFVELMKDFVSSLAPVNVEEAKYLLSKLKAKKVFEGFRNMEAVDLDTFAQLFASFSTIFEKYPDITEIDLNPLIAKGDKIIAVDARIIVEAK